jgi:TPR repeat protein
MLGWLVLLVGCGDPVPDCAGSDCMLLAEGERPGPIALALYERACATGEIRGCHEAARRREFGEGVDLDPAAAFAGYVAVCDAGGAPGCTSAANMLRKGTAPGGADPGRARGMLDTSCAAGDALGCASLAQLYALAGDASAAEGAARRSCDLGEQFGCALARQVAERPPAPADACAGEASPQCFDRIAWMLSVGEAPEKAEAVARLEQLCTGGSQESCVELGYVLSKGVGVEADPARAVALYEGACPTVPTACVNLAALLKEGRGAAPDAARRSALLSDACSRGLLEACVELGNDHFDAGRIDDARRAWRAACDAGVGLGCNNEADLLIGLATGPEEAAPAFELLGRACSLGEALACGRLGYELMRGVLVPADPIEGQRLLQHACQQGVTQACQSLP